MRKNAKWLILLILPFVILVVFFAFVHQSKIPESSKTHFTETKKVLLISSYSPSFETFFQQLDGVKSEFENENIVLDIECMDSKRFFTDEHINNFYTVLKYKLNHLPPYDAVLIADDNALNFALKHQTEFFDQTPLIFFGINDHQNALEASRDPFITGVTEDVPIYETIESASLLNPNAKSVVALVDSTTSGQADLASYYEEASKFENLKLTVLDLSDYTFDEYAQKLKSLDENNIVLLLSLYCDKTDTRITFQEGINYLLANCSQPVYHPYSHGIGSGLLGGKVVSHYEQGRSAAQIALHVLSGNPLPDVSLTNNHLNRYIFDYALIQKYHLNANLLPKETEYVNKEINLFELYRRHILFGIIVISSMLAVIIILLNSISKKDKAEAMLHEKNNIASKLNEQLARANHSLVLSIEKTKSQNKRIRELLYTDCLSGLNSRLAIEKIMQRHLAKQNENEQDAVLFIDIDNFKNINDTYGHDFGDQVIFVLGNKLKKLQNENIEIGRFGGDEFIIFIKNVIDEQEIVDFCNMLQKLFAVPFNIKYHSLFLTISIGVALSAQNEEGVQPFIKKADLALYKAKFSGKNSYVIYNESIEKELLRSADIQQKILKAANQEAFTLYYQPFVNAATHQLKGFEALIRLFDENNNQIPANEIIQNAESMGLISKIGEWVIEQAGIFCKKINEGRHEKLIVAVNVSAMQLNGKDFLARLISIVERLHIAPELICLEITETLLINSLEDSKQIIKDAHAYGFTVSLDDFGTGYSSLKYFKELPLDVIKIDRSFIENIATSPYEQNLISAISTLAHEKQMEVVAEGVETQQQFEYAKQLGCDIIQGYLFSKPLSEDDAIKYSQNN